MHKEVITRAFKKVKEEMKKEVGILPSVTSCAKHLSIIITEDYKFPYGEKSLRNLFKLALKENQNGFEIKQPKVVNGLCNYLGFDNYENFVLKNHSKQKEDYKVKNNDITINYSETKKKKNSREKNIKTEFKIIVSIKLEKL